MKKILIISLSLVTAINLHLAAIDVNQLINDLPKAIDRIKTFGEKQFNPESGIAANVKKIADSAGSFSAYMKCKILAKKDPNLKVSGRSCSDILSAADASARFNPASVVQLILDVLQRNVIGQGTDPNTAGFASMLIGQLKDVGVPEMDKVQGVLGDIYKVLQSIENLLKLVQK